MKKLFALGVLVLFALGVGSLLTPEARGWWGACGSYTNNNTNIVLCGGRLCQNLTTNSTNSSIVYPAVIISGTNVYQVPPGSIAIDTTPDPNKSFIKAVLAEDPMFVMWPRYNETPEFVGALEDYIEYLDANVQEFSGVYPDLDFTIVNNKPDYTGFDPMEIVGVLDVLVSGDLNEACDYYAMFVVAYEPYSGYAVVFILAQGEDFNCPSRPAP